MKGLLKSLIAATAELMPSASGASFTWVMECMDVAGEEIAAACKHNPRHKPAIEACFMATQPTDVLRSVPALYRVHVREIIMRAILGEPFDPATDAECLAAMSAMSLQAPPRENFAALYERLFKQCLPEQWKTLDNKGKAREAYPGACNELLVELRRKLLKPGRNTPKKESAS